MRYGKPSFRGGNQCLRFRGLQSVPLLTDHYSNIADNYDKFFASHYGFVADATIRLLGLQPDDKLVDVGGGTGGVARAIWTRAGSAK